MIKKNTTKKNNMKKSKKQPMVKKLSSNIDVKNQTYVEVVLEDDTMMYHNLTRDNLLESVIECFMKDKANTVLLNFDERINVNTDSGSEKDLDEMNYIIDKYFMNYKKVYIQNRYNLPLYLDVKKARPNKSLNEKYIQYDLIDNNDTLFVTNFDTKKMGEYIAFFKMDLDKITAEDKVLYEVYKDALPY